MCMTDEAKVKYNSKRVFCGRCIQKRLHRSDPDWNYYDEFSYEWPEREELSDEDKKTLNLLRSCMM